MLHVVLVSLCLFTTSSVAFASDRQPVVAPVPRPEAVIAPIPRLPLDAPLPDFFKPAPESLQTLARHDAKRSAEQAVAVLEQSKAAAANAQPSEAALAEAGASKTAAEAKVTELTAAITTADATRQTAEQAIADANAAVAKSTEIATQFETLLTQAVEQQKSALAARDAAVREFEAASIGRDVLEAAKTSLEQTATAVETSIAQAQQAKQLALTLSQAAGESVPRAEKAAADATQQLALLTDQKQQADSALVAMTTKVTEAEAALKPLLEAKAIAAKAAADAKLFAEQLAARVEVFSASTPYADPAAIREIKSYGHNRPLLSCRIDANGDFAFVGAQDAVMHRFDLFTGGQTPFEGQTSWIQSFDLSQGGELLASGGYAGRLVAWNPAGGPSQPLFNVAAHQSFVRCVELSPDGRYIATGGNDNMVRIWSAADGTLVAELAGHDRHVYNLGFHPNGRTLVSGDLLGVLKQWDVETWKHVRDLDAKVLHKFDESFRADCGGIRGLDFSPDGKYLVVCGISEVTNAFAGVGVPTAVLFNAATGEQLKVMKPKDNFQGSCWTIEFHPSGRFIVGGGGGGSGSLWFWKPGEEKSFFDFKMPSVVYDVSFHPDTLRMAAALFDNTLRLYDLGPNVPVVAAAK